MSDETTTETADETPAAEAVTDGGADAVETTETVQPAAAPASGSSAGGGSAGAANVSGTPAIDIDAALNAKDILIDKFAAGLITADEYAVEAAKHDKAILKAQRELAKPAQQVQAKAKEQEAAAAYWQNWGKGDDVAQKIAGKTVKADRAAALFRDALAEVAANPRYQGRKEIDANSIAYDRWLDKLEAEAKKKPATAGTAAPNTRITPDVSVSQSGGGSGQRRTAREKLEAGEYDLG